MQDQLDDLTAALEAQQRTLDELLRGHRAGRPTGPRPGRGTAPAGADAHPLPAARHRRGARPGGNRPTREKLTALHARLAEQVQALRTGEDWQRWLDVAGRFHTYSFNNTLLIYAQRPDASAVAGYQAWQTLGRQVDKGEKGIQILAPIRRRPRPGEPAEAGNPDTRTHPGQSAAAAARGAAPSGAETRTEETAGRGNAGRITGFRLAYVWDVTQTTGQPLPERPSPELLTGQAPPGLWDALTQLLADRGFTVERGDCGPANGYTDYPTRTVRIRDDVDDAQAVKTLIHEAGHVLLHDPTHPSPSTSTSTSTNRNAGTAGATTAHCRGIKEVEAESVAYLVAAAHGLDTGGYTFPYVTGWAAGVDGSEPEQIVRDTGQRVLTAARTVLAATTPDTADGAAEAALAARVEAGAERTAAAREHAATTRELAAPPAVDPAAAVAELDVLTRLHADATAFYTTQLQAGGTPDAARARAILDERGVPAAAVAGYQLGYAPPGWTALADHLRGRGWTDPQLLAAGVAMTTSRGTVVDRFRDRIMFPVHHPAGGRVIAFIGRALDAAEGTPKYLNSPDTALYRKGEVLYGAGAQPTREALTAGARPVLVEGALDAIAVTTASAGAYAGIAPSGTALTAAQVAALDAPPDRSPNAE